MMTHSSTLAWEISWTEEPGSEGQESLVCSSPWGDKESDTEKVLPKGSGVKGWSGGVLRARLCPLPYGDLDREKG